MTPRMPYRVPSMRRIGQGDDTRRLYKLESLAAEALGKAARELATVLVKYNALRGDHDYYHDVLPEAILTALEGQETRASLTACMAFVDWCRVHRPESFTKALQDWKDQRGPSCPICEGPV